MTDQSLRKLGMVCGIIGPLLLTMYFATPVFVSWPTAGAPPDQLMQYAKTHEVIFYLGAWLQATGALLCVVFFLVLVQLAGLNLRDDVQAQQYRQVLPKLSSNVRLHHIQNDVHADSRPVPVARYGVERDPSMMHQSKISNLLVAVLE